MRPAMVLFTAGAAGYQGNQHLELAAVVEFIHTATLLHDDVVDESDLRRGRKTSNAMFGNAPSILNKDYTITARRPASAARSSRSTCGVTWRSVR